MYNIHCHICLNIGLTVIFCRDAYRQDIMAFHFFKTFYFLFMFVLDAKPYPMFVCLFEYKIYKLCFNVVSAEPI